MSTVASGAQPCEKEGVVKLCTKIFRSGISKFTLYSLCIVGVIPRLIQANLLEVIGATFLNPAQQN